MRRTLVLAAAGLALLAGAVRLAAQSYLPFQAQVDAIRDRTKFRLGPLRFVPEFRLTDVGYDTNIYFAGEQREPVADFTATLSPELRGYWLASPTIIVWGVENPEYLAFARTEALRAFSNSVSGGLRWLLLRRFSLSAEYHDLSHVRRVQSELDHRIRDTSRGGSASLFFETPRGTAIGASYGLDDYRYRDVASGVPDPAYGVALDRRETRAAFETYYRVFSRSYFFSLLTWTRYEFRSEVSAGRDADSVEASGGFRFPLVGLARGTVRFGWKSLRPDDPLRTSFSGLVAGTSINLRLGRVALNLGLDRDIAFSYIESAYYYLDTRSRAGLSLYLLRDLRLDAAFNIGRMSYPEPQEIWVDGAPVVIDRRRDDQWDLSFGPVFRISGTTGLGATFNIYRRTSNAPGFDVRRKFIGAFITYEF